jgi:hypothetical protein
MNLKSRVNARLHRLFLQQRRCGNELSAEHPVKHIAAEQHAYKNWPDKIGATRPDRNGNRQQPAVRRAEGRCREHALREILDMNGTVVGKELQRHTRTDHGHERADNRHIRRHASVTSSSIPIRRQTRSERLAAGSQTRLWMDAAAGQRPFAAIRLG